MPIQIGYMIPKHYAAVLAIEAKVSPNPWSHKYLQQKIAEHDVMPYVATASGFVIGYFAYAVYKEVFDVLNIAVHPQCQKNGIGSQMVQYMINKMLVHNRTSIVVPVPERNLPMQCLLRHNGFRCRCITDGLEPDDEQTYVFRYSPGEASQPSGLGLIRRHAQ